MAKLITKVGGHISGLFYNICPPPPRQNNSPWKILRPCCILGWILTFQRLSTLFWSKSFCVKGLNLSDYWKWDSFLKNSLGVTNWLVNYFFEIWWYNTLIEFVHESSVHIWNTFFYSFHIDSLQNSFRFKVLDTTEATNWPMKMFAIKNLSFLILPCLPTISTLYCEKKNDTKTPSPTIKAPITNWSHLRNK